MTIEQAANELGLISLVVSSVSATGALAAVVVAVTSYRYAKKQAMVESFISIANSFLTSDTRKARRNLRRNEILTGLKKETDPYKLPQHTGKKDLSDEENNQLWEVVSAYNRLGFVLHKFEDLKDEFLEWDAETVVDMWERVRLYVIQRQWVSLP